MVDFPLLSAKIGASCKWQSLTSSTLGLWRTGVIRLFTPAVCESRIRAGLHGPGRGPDTALPRRATDTRVRDRHSL